jgi:hypothetical protein
MARTRTRPAGPHEHRPRGEWSDMPRSATSASPMILLRISDGSVHVHRSFGDFGQAVDSAEAYAGAGFKVAMISATGRFLMAFAPRGRSAAGGPAPRARSH